MFPFIHTSIVNWYIILEEKKEEKLLFPSGIIIIVLLQTDILFSVVTQSAGAAEYADCILARE